jgi:hypothetical protein
MAWRKVARHRNQTASMNGPEDYTCRYFVATNIMLLDIIHHPVFIQKHVPVYFSKHNVSETGFCLRLQVQTEIEKSIEPNWVGFTWRRKQNAVSETMCFEK